jgi:uncharacterized membrane protein
MLPRLVLAAALGGATLASGAYATLPRHLPFAPPTAAELGLVGASAQQWDALRQDTLALRQSTREQARARTTEFDALLGQPAPDLRGFSHAVQHDVDAALAQSRQLTERKLDFYDTLAPADQARLRQSLQDELARAQRLRAAMVSLLQDVP